MRVLVTGATGFLGRRLVGSLAAEGHEVVALSRSATASAAIRAMAAQPVSGDLVDPSSLQLPAVDAVVHAAAHFRLAGPRQPFAATNVDGTKALLAAAHAAGAARFVYIGAAAVVMDDRGSPIADADESSPIYPDSFSAYIATKAQAEAAVLRANVPGFTTLALRPPGIWGPGDAFSRALPEMIRRRHFAFIDRGDYPYVTCHVDNVVEAVRLALRVGDGGTAYFINDPEPTSFRDFVAGIATAHGLSVAHAPSIPYRLAWIAGGLLEGVARLGRWDSDPPMSRTMVRLIGREFRTSDARARSDLGYRGAVARAAGLGMYPAR